MNWSSPYHSVQWQCSVQTGSLCLRAWQLYNQCSLHPLCFYHPYSLLLTYFSHLPASSSLCKCFTCIVAPITINFKLLFDSLQLSAFMSFIVFKLDHYLQEHEHDCKHVLLSNFTFSLIFTHFISFIDIRKAHTSLHITCIIILMVLSTCL